MNKFVFKRNTALVTILLSILPFQNCSLSKQQSMLELQSKDITAAGGLLDPQPTAVVGNSIEAKAINLLQSRCYACHGAAGAGGVSQINNPTALIAAGHLIPGNATGSRIYDAAVAGRMPIGSGLLTAAELLILSDWINSGAKAPTAGSVNEPVVIPLEAKFSSLNANVFAPKCVYCHSATNAKGGVKLDTYAAIKKYITVSNATRSKIYEISVSGEMPPSPNPNLTTDELKALSDWINAGALNN